VVGLLLITNATDRRRGTFQFNPFLEDTGLTLAYGTRIFGTNLLLENIDYQRHIDGLKQIFYVHFRSNLSDVILIIKCSRVNLPSTPIGRRGSTEVR
jgi:hypothetical protein